MSEKLKEAKLLSVSRREVKYLISLEDRLFLIDALDKLLTPDSYGGYDGYVVRSVYFDSLANDDYIDKKNKSPEKKRIRMRVYNPDDKKVKFELKRKSYGRELKESLMITRDDAKALINREYGVLLRYDTTAARYAYDLMSTSWFLHYYEKTLNKNVQSYMRQFFMQGHFADLKQAYIAGLLKALAKYTSDGGASFVSFKEYYVEREILDYIRSMRTGFTVQSLAEYSKLRKAMAVWDKYDRSYADTAIEAVAAELGETTDDTKEILLGGLFNENRVDLYQQYAEDDEAEST